MLCGSDLSKALNQTYLGMNIVYILVCSIISLFSILFFISRFRMATPAQRPMLIGAACGALALGAGILILLALR